MLAYHVRWDLQCSPVSKKGRPSKDSQTSLSATVLCNNVSDALGCFSILFRREHLNDGVTLDDGELTFSRMKLDSRNFHIQWLFMKGLTEPISLIDPAKSIFLKHSYL